MSRIRREVDDLLQKSRDTKDMLDESEVNAQRKFMSSSGDNTMNEPSLQTSSYDPSDVGGAYLKDKNSEWNMNSPSTNLPGSFPTNELEGNKRHISTAIDRLDQSEGNKRNIPTSVDGIDQSEGISGTTKDTALTTDYSAGQIDKDPNLSRKAELPSQKLPSSDATAGINSNVETNQSDMDPVLSKQSQSASQRIADSNFNTSANTTGLTKDYTAGQIDDDPILGIQSIPSTTGVSGTTGVTSPVGANTTSLTKDYAAGQIDKDPILSKQSIPSSTGVSGTTGVAGTVSANNFGSTDISKDTSKTGKDSGTGKAAVAAAAGGGIGAKIGSILNRRKSKDVDMPKTNNSNDGNKQNKDWKYQSPDARQSLDVQRGGLNGDDTSFGDNQSGNLISETKGSDVSGIDNTYGNKQSGNLNSQTKGSGLSGNDNTYGSKQSGNLNIHDPNTKSYRYNEPSQLDSLKNQASGLNNEVSSNAATFGSTDVPYDSGNLDNQIEQEQPSSQEGAKVAAAGAGAGGIGALLSSVLDRRKSSGDTKDKNLGKKGDVSSGNIPGQGDFNPSGNISTKDISPPVGISGNTKDNINASGDMNALGIKKMEIPRSSNLDRNTPSAANADLYTRGDNSNMPDKINSNLDKTRGVNANIPDITNSNMDKARGINANMPDTTNSNMDKDLRVDANVPDTSNRNLDKNRGINADMPDTSRKLDNTHGIDNAQNDRTVPKADNQFLQPPGARSSNKNEPISNENTLVDGKPRRRRDGPASYLFGSELMLQGRYKIFLSKFLHNDAMRDEGLELKRKGEHILEMYRTAHGTNNNHV
ncbi:hypothetical protein BGW37DRAFT_536740 [Umbelopsis sp. PMI_123]|nr:hypothetical protein BGW37DRAFT_536740 [Umbelopsis sp. PMI_123]